MRYDKLSPSVRAYLYRFEAFWSCQDNNVCIRLRRIRAKMQLRRLVNCRYQRAAELWVTTAAGPSPAATHTGPASRWPVGRPACPPLPVPGQHARGVHGR